MLFSHLKEFKLAFVLKEGEGRKVTSEKSLILNFEDRRCLPGE